VLHSLRLRVVGSLIATLGVCVLAAPAAQADEHWQRLADPAPGGTTGFDDPHPSVTVATVAGDTAYLATVEAHRITVYRARPRDNRWREVGLTRRDPSAAAARGASMATTGRTVWLAWYEHDGPSLWRVHLAQSSGGPFREVAVGSPSTDEPGNQDIDIAGYRSRVYVASTGSVARLSRNGRRLEDISDGLDLVDAGQPLLVASGDSLYAAQGRGKNSGDLFQTIVARLNTRTGSWQRIAKADGFFRDAAGGAGKLCVAIEQGVSCLTGTALTPLPDPGWPIQWVQIVRGVLYAAGGEMPFPDAPDELKIFVFENGAWRQLPDPIAPDLGLAALDMLDSNDTLWLHWESSPRGPFSFPITAHVARLLR
jgi:hypothetical protein